MTITRAKVTKEFDGVEDGKVYPRKFEVGEEISGDLADAAIRQKNAKETSASKAARGASEAEESDLVEKNRAADEASKAAAAKRKSDLAVLAHFTPDELANIAAQHEIDIANLKTVEEVRDAIVRELPRLDLNATSLKPAAPETKT